MILYIGNMLSRHGYSPTSVETIGLWLETLYPVKRVSSYRNQFCRLLHMWITVIKYRNKCEMILIDTYSSRAFLYALSVACIARVFNIKYMPILHGGLLPARFDRQPKLARYFIENSSKLVAPSGYLKYEVERRGWGHPVVIPNSVQIDHYPFRKREVISPKLFWVRSFHKIYNPLMALDVLKLLRGKGYNAYLCMIGQDKDGSMTEFKRQVREYGLEEFVEVTGKLSKEEWIRKSVEFDVFLNTTDVDNTPVSVIEAMALGLPVVSTDVGGIPFLLNNRTDALLVNKGDTKRMAESVIELMESPDLLHEISIQARKKAEEFSWQAVQQKWIDLFEKI